MSSLPQLPEETHPKGLIEVYNPPHGDAVADIVLVHGLGGSAKGTWTKGNTFWPRDLLPKDIPNARVLVYGYDSDPARWLNPASTNMLHHHATTLVSELHYLREEGDLRERPIIWVCHSLGGIVVKRALIYSSSYNITHNDDSRSLKVSSYGIVFLGTPHMGSDVAKWGQWLESIVRTVGFRVVDSNPALVNALGKNSETLQNITDAFLPIASDLALFFFWEEYPTKGNMIVDYSSAVPDSLPNAGKASISANHTEMCKFETTASPGWNVLKGVLKQFVKDAPRTVELNWEKEYRSKHLATEYKLRGAVEGYHKRPPSPGARDGYRGGSQSPGGHTITNSHTPKLLQAYEISESDEDPLQLEESGLSPMLKPATLQENAYFIARESELETIDKVMSSRPPVLCIAAGTGQGKTHLAREYFFRSRHRKRYPAGVFWLDCKGLRGTGHFSTDVLDAQFCTIAEALNLPVMIDRFEAHIDQSEVTRRQVIAWFEQNKGWLLVLDGVDVSEDSQSLAQIDDVARYIPTISGGSIIITTLNHSLGGAARLGSPQLLRLPLISAGNAVKMLFHYAQIPLSAASDHDKEDAKKLVAELAYIPLMIHSAGSYIKLKSASVSLYLRDYRRKPFVDQAHKDVLPFHVIFSRIETNYPKAHNLLRVLTFWEQVVPIEMLLWGINDLEKREKTQFIVYEEGRWTINNTIGHLLAHSLVERTQQIEADAPDHPPVDTLRLHSVAQEVSISRMRASSRFELLQWLVLAITIFCNSSDSLDRRRGDGDFLLSDYKQYLLHGKRLESLAEKYHLKPHHSTDSPVRETKFNETLWSAVERLGAVLEKVKELASGDITTGERRSMFRSGSITDASSIETPTPSSPRGTLSWPWDYETGQRAHSPELVYSNRQQFRENLQSLEAEKPFYFRYYPPDRSATTIEPRNQRSSPTSSVYTEDVFRTTPTPLPNTTNLRKHFNPLSASSTPYKPPTLTRERSGSLPANILMPPYPVTPTTILQRNPFDTVNEHHPSSAPLPAIHHRPFERGFVPPKDVTASPVARSIVPPRERPSLSDHFATSEPILAHPQQATPSSRGRSSSGSRRGASRSPSPGIFVMDSRTTTSSPGLGILVPFSDEPPHTRHQSLGDAPTASQLLGLPTGRRDGGSPLRRSSVPDGQAAGGEAMGRSRSAPGAALGSEMMPGGWRREEEEEEVD